MLKNRAFLMGAGAGIVAGALLLQLMTVGADSRDRLSALNPGEKTYTQAEVDAMLAAERESLHPSESPSGEPAPSKAPADGPQTASPRDDAERPASVLRLVRIEAGMGLGETGELLKSEGVVADSAVFVQRMKKSGKPVRAGYFLFPAGTEPDDAIGILTSAPLSKAQAELLKERMERVGAD